MSFSQSSEPPMPTAGFRKMLARTADGAEFPFPVHPDMPWHACGYRDAFQSEHAA
jgi:hypothetical protein